MTRAEKAASTRRKNREAEKNEEQRLIQEGTRREFAIRDALMTGHLIFHRDAKGKGESP